MKTRNASRAWRCAPVLVLTLAGLAAPASGDVVYDSYDGVMVLLYMISEQGEPHSGTELPGGFENDAAGADVVTLAGTDRFVTEFMVGLGRAPVDGTQSVDATLTLYANDGGLPGDVLWSGTIAGIAPSVATEVVFSPNITVPDSFIFGLSLANIVGQTGGMGPMWTTAAPTVGSSDSAILRQDSTTLEWEPDPFSPPTYNLQARITAVPAPAGALPLLFGIAAARRRAR